MLGDSFAAVAALLDLKAPFAETSCNILLLDGAAGVVLFGFGSAFTVVFFVEALVVFAAFFTTSSSPFTAFAALVAFVEAFLVFAFLTSSTVSSITFLGRPRPRFGIGSVAVAVAALDIVLSFAPIGVGMMVL